MELNWTEQNRTAPNLNELNWNKLQGGYNFHLAEVRITRGMPGSCTEREREWKSDVINGRSERSRTCEDIDVNLLHSMPKHQSEGDENCYKKWSRREKKRDRRQYIENQKYGNEGGKKLGALKSNSTFHWLWCLSLCHLRWKNIMFVRVRG